MGKNYDQITPELAAWLGEQRIFFVATAPLAADGLVNCSPKGMDTFRVLGPHEVGYLDLTGSGIETIAHLRENARIVVMFCAFKGPPKIVRMWGRGVPLLLGSPEFETLRAAFPTHDGARAVIRVQVDRIMDSCGYAVPTYEYLGDREQLAKHAAAKGPAALAEYRKINNARSLEGLPGIDPSSG